MLAYETVAEPDVIRTADFLGGQKILGGTVGTALEAHDILQRGLSAKALMRFMAHFRKIRISSQAVQAALGMSLRTLQRKSNARAAHERLTPEQSARIWKFAEIMARASDIFGSTDLAENWLTTPAMALDGRCPIDLLSSPAGIDLVEDHLTRLDYGVYT